MIYVNRLDPSIRITYHPRKEEKFQSKGLTTSTTHVFSQTITVSNTKPMLAEGIGIVEQIPVSEDPQIEVKLLKPAPTRSSSMEEAVAKPVVVSEGVWVMLDGADGLEPNVQVLGCNGKLFWVCYLPPRRNIKLELQWEVSAPTTA